MADNSKQESEEETVDIDRALEEGAKAFNLTATNVKSLIHHVLKDKRVVAMATGQADDCYTEELDYQDLKLTRSRVRQSLSVGQLVDPLTPIKATLSVLSKSPLKKYIPPDAPLMGEVSQPVQRVLDLAFPEDDPSDEEYDPEKQKSEVYSSDEDSLQFGSDISSLLSTPERHQRRTNRKYKQAVTEQYDIPTRTRSKHPLSELTLSEIEATFVAPDVDPVPEERSCDLDEEDIQWRLWLQELMCEPTPPPDSEDKEDMDYNFLSDQETAHEREEFRNDRAVRIPDNELSDLIEELMETYVPTDSRDTVSATMSPNFVVHGNTGPAKPCLSEAQHVQLWMQIQQYFQLLMQTFLLARYEPSLLFIAQITGKAVEELKELDARGGSPNIWYIPFLSEGRDIIKSLNPYTESLSVPDIVSAHTRPPVCNAAIEVMMNKPLFWMFPTFLPRVGFIGMGSSLGSKSFPFTPAEDNLLAIGMQRFGNTSWEEIKSCLLPSKTISQMKTHVKNLNVSKRKDNIIKHLKETGQVRLAAPTELELPFWVAQYKELKIMQKGNIVVQSQPKKENKHIVPKGGPLGENPSSSQTRVGINPKSPIVPKSKSPLKYKISTVRRRIAGHSPNVQMDQVNTVLKGARLQASDTTAQFLFCFLNEVKNELSSDTSVYDDFLRVLLKAKSLEWTPQQIYVEVKSVLKGYPHLIQIFADFLSPEEAIAEGVLKDKVRSIWAKAFIAKLQNRFSSNKQQFSEILQILSDTELDKEKVTRDVVPLLSQHPDLLQDLMDCISDRPPSLFSAEDYEHVDFDLQRSTAEMDQVERITFKEAQVPNGNTKRKRGNSFPKRSKTLKQKSKKPISAKEKSITQKFSNNDLPEHSPLDVGGPPEPSPQDVGGPPEHSPQDVGGPPEHSPQDVGGPPEHSPLDVGGPPEHSPQDVGGPPEPSPLDVGGLPEPSPQDVGGPPERSPQDVGGPPEPSPQDVGGPPEPSPQDVGGPPEPSPLDVGGLPEPSPQDVGGPPECSPQDVGGPPEPSPQDVGGPPEPSPQDVGGPPEPSPQDVGGPPEPSPQDVGGPPEHSEVDILKKDWTKTEDKRILQISFGGGITEQILEGLASDMLCTKEEVSERHLYLLEQYKVLLQKQKNN